jgi:peptidoglycan hydrolase-like protein with peptidoglycan-binding domain
MNNVGELQRFLRERGFDIGRPDGVLGPQTVAALQRHLRANGYPDLRPDGIFGTETQRAYEDARAKGLFSPRPPQGGRRSGRTRAPRGAAQPPKPEDFVIAIVFPEQPIQFQTERGVREALPDWMESAALDALELFGAKRTDSGSLKADFLGHAAVAFADGRTGVSRYWEYGRYDAAQRGICRNISVPNLRISPDFEATPQSLNALFSTVSRKSGAGTRVAGVLGRVPLGTHRKLEAYCRRVDANTRNKTAPEYAVLSNSCLHFMRRVMDEAGLDTPAIWDPRPASYIAALQDRFPPLHWPDQNRR